MSHKHEHLQTAIIENLKWVDKMLWIGFSLGMVLIGLKITGKDTFEWSSLHLKTSDSWIVFLLLTIAHAYITILLLRSINLIWKKAPAEVRVEVFNTITSTGGIFVRGLTPRIKNDSYSILGKKITMTRVDLFDPSVWASLLGIFVLIVAVVPFSMSDHRSLISHLVIALLLSGINWILGSQWAIALSELAEQKEKSHYLQRLQRAFKTDVYFPIFPNVSGPPGSRLGLDIPWFVALFFLPVYVSYGLVVILIVLIVLSLILLNMIMKIPITIYRILSTRVQRIIGKYRN